MPTFPSYRNSLSRPHLLIQFNVNSGPARAQKCTPFSHFPPGGGRARLPERAVWQEKVLERMERKIRTSHQVRQTPHQTPGLQDCVVGFHKIFSMGNAVLLNVYQAWGFQPSFPLNPYVLERILSSGFRSNSLFYLHIFLGKILFSYPFSHFYYTSHSSFLSTGPSSPFDSGQPWVGLQR